MTRVPTTADRRSGIDASSKLETGVEWVVDAHGCDPELLRCLGQIVEICEQAIVDLGLNVVGNPQTHQFPDPFGVTALYMLSESHLACHTYPERSLATFNLYCCRARPPWKWEVELRQRLSASRVQIQQIQRGRQ